MHLPEIRLLFLDVDGVLTDGRVTVSSDGDGAKAFYVHDGFAIKLWQRAGGRVAILSGRNSEDVKRRAAELGIEHVMMGLDEKMAAFRSVLAKLDLHEGSAAYVGDDVPDVPPMCCCAVPIAVADAVPQVKRIARFVTRRCGGRGAVAEAIEWLLRSQGLWTPTICEYSKSIGQNGPS